MIVSALFLVVDWVIGLAAIGLLSAVTMEILMKRRKFRHVYASALVLVVLSGLGTTYIFQRFDIRVYSSSEEVMSWLGTKDLTNLVQGGVDSLDLVTYLIEAAIAAQLGEWLLRPMLRRQTSVEKASS